MARTPPTVETARGGHTADGASALVPPSLVAYLARHGVEAAFLAPGVPMPTVPAAAAAIGVAEDQVLKSLLFRDNEGRFVLAIACGTGRIDRERLAAASGMRRPKLADAPTVLAVTGFPAGGVAPVGHATPVPVVLDRRAAALEIAYGGGGVDEVLLRIRPTDILRLTGGTVADIVADAGNS